MEILKKINNILKGNGYVVKKTMAPYTLSDPNIFLNIPKGTKIEVQISPQSDGSIVLAARSLRTNTMINLMFDNKKEMSKAGWSI